MAAKNIVCWKCGGKLASYCFPIRSRDLCPHCREDLHVCLMCRAYSPHASGKCRKEEADYVSNKERANYCHYFKPLANAYKPVDNSAQQALDKLSSLFGDDESNNEHLKKDFKQHAQQAEHELHNLFNETTNKEEDLSAEEKARQELDLLFGKPKS